MLSCLILYLMLAATMNLVMFVTNMCLLICSDESPKQAGRRVHDRANKFHEGAIRSYNMIIRHEALMPTGGSTRRNNHVLTQDISLNQNRH